MKLGYAEIRERLELGVFSFVVFVVTGKMLFETRTTFGSVNVDIFSQTVHIFKL